MLILAGAGSGKTRVITHRIAWLIQDVKGVLPRLHPRRHLHQQGRQRDGRARRDRLIGQTSLAQPCSLATFHSFCVRTLRRDVEALRVGNGVGLTQSTFAIYDETDQQAVVKQAMQAGLGHG